MESLPSPATGTTRSTWRVVGVVLIVLALIVGCVELLALVDPVGTKMADDADPFGPPPSAAGSAIGLLASVVIGALGVWLARPPKRRV